jgi:hypothetical protein
MIWLVVCVIGLTPGGSRCAYVEAYESKIICERAKPSELVKLQSQGWQIRSAICKAAE